MSTANFSLSVIFVCTTSQKGTFFCTQTVLLQEVTQPVAQVQTQHAT